LRKEEEKGPSWNGHEAEGHCADSHASKKTQGRTKEKKRVYRRGEGGRRKGSHQFVNWQKSSLWRISTGLTGKILKGQKEILRTVPEGEDERPRECG